MSETCTVNIQNNSGRQLDAVMMWHTSATPGVSDLLPSEAVVQGTNVAAGATLTGTAELTRFSPTDFWTAGVRFQGDGEVYVVAGFSGQAYKEYEVSDGSTITFIVNEYSVGTANQNNVTIQYSGDDGGTAFLLNHTTVSITSLGTSIVNALLSLL
ncbi:MAG TPA: hypothetical protein VM890_12405 [Longimicrobium sp.]|nr:hypothetical protein [Longimicrobium sp.]